MKPVVESGILFAGFHYASRPAGIIDHPTVSFMSKTKKRLPGDREPSHINLITAALTGFYGYLTSELKNNFL
jgi:hypothetical protein